MEFNLALISLVLAAIALYGTFAPWVSIGITSVSGNRSNEGIFPFGVLLTLVIFGLTRLISTLKHLCQVSIWLLIVSSGWSLASYYEWYQKVNSSISQYKSSLNNDQMNSLGILGKDFTNSLQTLTNSLKPNFAVGFWISIVVALVGLMLGAISLWSEKQSEESQQEIDFELSDSIVTSSGKYNEPSKRISKSVLILSAVAAVGLAITFGVNIRSAHKISKTQVTASPAMASASPVSIPSDYYHYDSNFSYKLLDHMSQKECNPVTTFCFHISLISQTKCPREYRFFVRFFTPSELSKAFALVDFSVKPESLALGVPHEIKTAINFNRVQSSLDVKTLEKDWASRFKYQIDKISCV